MSITPRYRHASYAGETLTMENAHLRLEVHKRMTGWGWGEIYTPTGKWMAVLDHLGEIMIRDQEIPMRLEAAEPPTRERSPRGESLTFQVRSLVVREKLQGTSFEPWINYPLEQPCMEGQVTITLAHDQPLLLLSYRLISLANQYARYVRGPWLKVGAGSFGAGKDDAILPGVEWLVGDEWSSGTNWFKDPWALRSLYKALIGAREKVAAALSDNGAFSAMIPLLPSVMDETREIFGKDFWPYGMEKNRSTLEKIALYTYQQGISSRLLDVEELFEESVRDL